MQVTDEAQWSHQLAVLEQDTLGRTFSEYLLFWVDAAERMMQERGLSAYDALQEAFPIAEEEFEGMDGDFLPDMLLFIVGMWVHGADLVERMTPIETKILTNAAANKVAELQAQAALDSEQTGNRAEPDDMG